MDDAPPHADWSGRLALQAAGQLLDAFQDGVWSAELAPISDAALIPRTIMSALDMPEHTGRTPTDALIDRLRPRELLLVLDNCEHVSISHSSS